MNATMRGESSTSATLTVGQESMIPKFMFDSLRSSHESLKHRYTMLENTVAEVQGENDGLKRQQTQDKTRIAQLEKDYLSYRNTLRQEQSIIYHPKIQQTRDRIVLNKLCALEAIKKPDENGFFEFNSDEVIKGAHVSKGAFFDGMTSLEKHGVVERDPNNYETTDKRVCRIKLNPAVHSDVANCVKEVESNYGGARVTQCPECNKERIKKTRKKATLCQCLDCKHQWVEDESEKVIVEPIVTAQDYAESPPQSAPNNDVTDNALNQHMDTLFPEEEKPRSKPKSNVDPRLPDRDCLKCGARKWEWDDVFDMPKCGECG